MRSRGSYTVAAETAGAVSTAPVNSHFFQLAFHRRPSRRLRLSPQSSLHLARPFTARRWCPRPQHVLAPAREKSVAVAHGNLPAAANAADDYDAVGVGEGR